MTIVRPIFFGYKLLFVTRNFVFGMNIVVKEYEISSSELIRTNNIQFLCKTCWEEPVNKIMNTLGLK